MSNVGIISAKSNSNRFPNKNIYELDGYPLFWYSVKPLIECKYIDDVYVVTDSHYIKRFCEDRGVKVIWRGVNAIHDEEPLLGVLRYGYKCIDKSYDNIVTIMANCPNHTVEVVNESIEFMMKSDLLEVRSFNKEGVESGLMIFKEKVILNTLQISSHIGYICSNVKEIHYKEDLL